MNSFKKSLALLLKNIHWICKYLVTNLLIARDRSQFFIGLLPVLWIQLRLFIRNKVGKCKKENVFVLISIRKKIKKAINVY